MKGQSEIEGEQVQVVFDSSEVVDEERKRCLVC